jgi:predicted nucleic-acid-binding protein
MMFMDRDDILNAPGHGEVAATAASGSCGYGPGDRGRCIAAGQVAVIGLDTNILIRYLTQDDPAQSRKAAKLIEQELTEESPSFISVVTMADIASVLDGAYSLTNAEIAAHIERLLQVDVFVVEHEQQVFGAMVALAEGAGSFADALIGLLGQRAGCSVTMTFDRRASRLPGFTLLN